MTIEGESDCGGACGVGGLDSYCCGAGEDDLDLDSAILLFILSFIALISSLKLFIIACRAPIVTSDSAAAVAA